MSASIRLLFETAIGVKKNLSASQIESMHREDRVSTVLKKNTAAIREIPTPYRASFLSSWKFAMLKKLIERRKLENEL